MGHYTTICLVPPPDDKDVWDRLTAMRTELRDPSLFRWPPHVNLLYPFITIKRKEQRKNEKLFETLYNITRKYEPFQVTLETLGCFGNERRGVLWLHPRCNELSSYCYSSESNGSDDYNDDDLNDVQSQQQQEQEFKEEESDILQRIQNDLQAAFPLCHEQRKGGIFVPHMTLTHFPSLSEAKDARSSILKSGKFEPIKFVIKEIYLLKRFEPDGQFLMYATLPLGSGSNDNDGSIMELYETNARKFPHMPLIEEDWVYKERMKLKERRNNHQRKRSYKSKKKLKNRKKEGSNDLDGRRYKDST